MCLIFARNGQTSPASTITHLTAQIVYVGSHFGDSQLLRINSGPVGSLRISTLPVPPDVSAIPAPQIFLPKGKERATEFEADGVTSCVIETMGSYVTVLRTFQNIAPIADAALVDLDGTGQASLHFFNAWTLPIGDVASHRHMFWWTEHWFFELDPKGGQFRGTSHCEGCRGRHCYLVNSGMVQRRVISQLLPR
jgi:hypothetical protein